MVLSCAWWTGRVMSTVLWTCVGWGTTGELLCGDHRCSSLGWIWICGADRSDKWHVLSPGVTGLVFRCRVSMDGHQVWLIKLTSCQRVVASCIALRVLGRSFGGVPMSGLCSPLTSTLCSGVFFRHTSFILSMQVCEVNKTWTKK